MEIELKEKEQIDLGRIGDVDNDGVGDGILNSSILSLSDEGVAMSIDNDRNFVTVADNGSGTGTSISIIKIVDDATRSNKSTDNGKKSIDVVVDDNDDDDDDDDDKDDDNDNNGYLYKDEIPYVDFNNPVHYLHRDEDHCLVLVCKRRYWYWTILERGFGFDTEHALDDKDIDNNSFAPKLFWKTPAITGKEVDTRIAMEEKNKQSKGTRTRKSIQPILATYFPKQLWKDLAYGRSSANDDDDNADDEYDDNDYDCVTNIDFNSDVDILKLVSDDKLLYYYRNKMKIPALRVYVLSSYQTCTKPDKSLMSRDDKIVTSDPIHYKYLKRHVLDENKSIQYLLKNIPTTIYRIHPNDMAMAHIQPPLPQTLSLSSSAVPVLAADDAHDEKYNPATIQLLQNVTIEQWSQLKAIDIIYPNRPAIIVDGTDDGLTITTTDVTLNGLTIVGQNRTSSVSTRLNILNDYCLDKLATSSNTRSHRTNTTTKNTSAVIEFSDSDDDDDDDDGNNTEDKYNPIDVRALINEIITNMKNPNGKKFPLYTKTSKFESVSTAVTEVALLLHSIIRTWVGKQLLNVSNNDTTEQISLNTKEKPIVIVTGSDAEILMLLLNPEICRKVLHLPISSLYKINATTDLAATSTAAATTNSDAVIDEADFLNQVEIVHKKHLTVHGITSFLIDMGAACAKRARNDMDKMNMMMMTEMTTTILLPTIVLGVRVAKYFNTDLYRGTVVSYSADDQDDTNEGTTTDDVPTFDKYFFSVLYDDGDKEEYDIHDLLESLLLYDKHVEDDSNPIGAKAMEGKRKQSEDLAIKVEQYMKENNITIGTSLRTKRKIREKTQMSSKRRNVKEEQPQLAETDNVDVKAAGVASEKEEETINDVGKDDNENAAKTLDPATPEKLDESISSPNTLRKRGRPRKDGRTSTTPREDPKHVAALKLDDFLGKRVCKLIEGEYYDGTVKKCQIEKAVNNRTGMIKEKITWIVLFDHGDRDEFDDKKDLRKMIRLYDERHQEDTVDIATTPGT